MKRNLLLTAANSLFSNPAFLLFNTYMSDGSGEGEGAGGGSGGAEGSDGEAGTGEGDKSGEGDGGSGRLYGDKDGEGSDDKEDKGDKPPEGEADDKGDKSKEGEGTDHKAEDYDFTIAEDVGLKDEKGEPYQLDPKDPFLAEVRKDLLEHKADPALAPKLASVFARVMKDTLDSAKTENQAAIEVKKTEELGKLATKSEDGSTVSGPARIEKSVLAVDKMLGEGASKELFMGITDSASFLRLEKLIELAAGGQVAGGGAGAGSEKSAAARLYGKR